MPEESTVVTPSQEVTATLTPAEQKESTLIVEGETSKSDYKPFFEKEVSEAELMGSEPEEKGEDSGTVPAEPAEPAKPKEVAKDSKEEDTEKEETKAPVGFVPKGALQEEREKRKQAQAEIDRLRQQLESKPPIEELKPEEKQKELLKSVGLPADFKILSESEEDALMEEDLFAYNKYQRALRKVERASHETAEKQRVEAEISAKTGQVVEGAVRRMETAVPGIHDPESEINKNLTEFATSHGFDAEYLNALTDPKTMFLPANGKAPMYLGDGAAALVEFIHNTFKAQDQTLNRAAMEKEITEKVTTELMKKFKSPGSDSKTFKSLGDAPGSTPDIVGGKFSEKDFAKMTAEEQRVALGG